MNEWCKKLANLIPPPANPEGVPFQLDRASLSSYCGSLPGDYLWICEHYGVGSFGFISVMLPDRLLLRELQEDDLLDFRRMNIENFGSFEYPIHPEPGGLLGFATDYGPGGVFAWKTEKDIQDWKVVYVYADGCQTFDMGLAEFFCKFFSSDIECKPFGRGPVEDWSFEPNRL